LDFGRIPLTSSNTELPALTLKKKVDLFPSRLCLSAHRYILLVSNCNYASHSSYLIYIIWRWHPVLSNPKRTPYSSLLLPLLQPCITKHPPSLSIQPWAGQSWNTLLCTWYTQCSTQFAVSWRIHRMHAASRQHTWEGRHDDAPCDLLGCHCNGFQGMVASSISNTP
jgi:hypothetical protein